MSDADEAIVPDDAPVTVPSTDDPAETELDRALREALSTEPATADEAASTVEEEPVEELPAAAPVVVPDSADAASSMWRKFHQPPPPPITGICRFLSWRTTSGPNQPVPGP